MTLGIVGHEAAKFTPDMQARARAAIAAAIQAHGATKVVSGACPMGGVDIWAIEEATLLGVATEEFAPTVHAWQSARGIGFMQRNIQIAEASDVVLCVVVKELPPTYTGMRFPLCYHCKTSDHVKSGGCWTALYAQRLGKGAEWVKL